MRRSRNITPADLDRIVGILDGWSGKLTWDLLLESILKHLRVSYTRQTLSNHERIKNAFNLRKRVLAGKAGETPAKSVPPEVKVLQDRVARLEGENERLNMENNKLIERFATWSYNAHLKGVSQDMLNKPLPSVNRDVTVR